VKDKYGDQIQDQDLCLIQTWKEDKDGQELYFYRRATRTFVPIRDSVRIGTYELVLREVHEQDLKKKTIRRLYQ